jgi:osmotically-inducible protein OsmY
MSAVMTEKTDSELQRAVLDELKWEPSVNATHIGVSVKNGIVTLSGHVPSYWQKYEAEKAAKRVYGVTAIANELSAKQPEHRRGHRQPPEHRRGHRHGVRERPQGEHLGAV